MCVCTNSFVCRQQTAKQPPEATLRGHDYFFYDMAQSGGEPIVSSSDEVSLYFKTRQATGMLFYTGIQIFMAINLVQHYMYVDDKQLDGVISSRANNKELHNLFSFLILGENVCDTRRRWRGLSGVDSAWRGRDSQHQLGKRQTGRTDSTPSGPFWRQPMASSQHPPQSARGRLSSSST